MRTIAILQQIDCGNCHAVAFDPPDQLERQIALEHAAGHGDGDVAAGCAPGDILFVEGELFLPDASSNAIGGFVPDLSNGVVSPAPGSPFPAGSGPLALAYSAFPRSIRHSRRCAEKRYQQSRVSFWNRWSFFCRRF
jgi:hypothetical protein